MTVVTELVEKASNSAQQLSTVSNEVKSKVLTEMANAIRLQSELILTANLKDLDLASKNQLPDAMIDRLTLNAERIEAMASGMEIVANLHDPVGSIRPIDERPNGLKISKMRVPLGVICMIYEARPNVTADAAALCIKSGNAVILKGGKEAEQSSLAIAKILQTVLRQNDLPEEIVTIIPNLYREMLPELLTQKAHIDLVIPRGGEGLINFVSENSHIPVIQHYKGVCHLYVDKSADLDKALNLLINGKTQRTGVCNALEGLLVHKDVADEFLTKAAQALKTKQVKVNACQRAAEYFDNATVLAEDQYGEEYLSLEIAIRIVESTKQAIEHIRKFGSNHTEIICTEDELKANKFQKEVDASVVMVNASSRFSDGSELGLGAEIGIATSKLHAYGPMGIESLTTEKFLVNGTGQIRA
ncbi:glutamate-5-semialdehyde dehydrogenase [Colwelliaceae bacterium 6441]